MERLTREQIAAAFERLDGWLGRAGKRAQVFVVGGAVMCLVHETRTSTKDVDAWFSDPAVVREGAKSVAEELGLPEDWLNDAAKGFLPPNAGFERWKTFSQLEVSVADDRTLLAMKCAAARTAEDARDIEFLAEKLGLKSSAAVISVVLAYYPPERLPVRTRLLLEELLDEGS
jgi:hypothetical protein